MNLPDAWLYDAVRTPRGRGKDNGSLYILRPIDLLVSALEGLRTRTHLPTQNVDDVVIGCVTQTGEQGACIARFAALQAGWDFDAPGVTLNRFCGSGLQAVVHATEGIRAGTTRLAVAGGAESMSNAPYLLTQARWGYRMGNGEALDSLLSDGLTCAINAIHMGITAEEVANRFGVSRQDQDESKQAVHSEGKQRN